MLNLLQTLRRVGSAMTFVAASLATHDAPTSQLGSVIGASGGIESHDGQLMRNGYAAALDALPTDGSIENTAHAFSANPVKVTDPAVMMVAALPSVFAEINTMAYASGNAATTTGMAANANAMTDPANVNHGMNSMPSGATDAASNIPNKPQRQEAIEAPSAAKAENIDTLTAGAIDRQPDSSVPPDLASSPSSGPCNNCGNVLADSSAPSNPVPSEPSEPLVLPVNDLPDFPVAIDTTAQAVAHPVPEPGELALFGVALAALWFSRRKMASRSTGVQRDAASHP